MTLYLETPDGFIPWMGQPIPTPLNIWGEPETVEQDGQVIQVRLQHTVDEPVSHPLSIEYHWTDEELAILHLYRPVPAEDVPSHHRIVSTDVTRVDGIVRFVYATEGIPLDERKAQIVAAIADRRWRAETGGLTFDAMRIPTDRETQAIIARTVQSLADGDITGPIKFKMPFGFVSITASHLAAIKRAGAEHIQACFDREADLVEAVTAAADHDALDAIDIETGWPGEEG